MKTRTETLIRASGAFLAVVVISVCCVGQTACRDAATTATERFEKYTLYAVSLPVNGTPVLAQALIPTPLRESSAVVFSLSELVTTQPDRKVDIMPVATEIAKNGRVAIIIERKLRWPEISISVGSMQAAVLCAQQWIAAHAIIKKDAWLFVGPKPDQPTFEQLKAVDDNDTMTFQWGFPLGGPNDSNTDEVLGKGVLSAEELIAGIVDF